MSNFKSGLDYFSFDIDFFNDEKIEFISAKFGVEGEIIAIKLLCKIYRNGYYLKWDEDKCLLFSKKIGGDITPELINNVIKELIKRGFFNKKMLNKYQILTSHGIQKRYIEAIKRRKKIVIYKEYLLCNHSVDIIPNNVNIISVNDDIINNNDDIIDDNVDEKKGKEKKGKYADTVTMFEKEYKKLIEKYGKEDTESMVKILDYYKDSKGKTYKSDYKAILSWVVDKLEEIKIKKRKGKNNGSKEYKTIN